MRQIVLGTAALAAMSLANAQETPERVETQTTVLTSETETTGKTVVVSEADLPRSEFTLGKKPSEIVLEDTDAFNTLVNDLDMAITDLLDNYDIADAATRSDLLNAERVVLSARGDWEGILATTDALRAAATKPAEREMTGVLSDSYARAALEIGVTEGDAFKQAYKRELRAALAKVDVSVARDELQAMRGQMQLVNAALLEAALKGQIDPLVAQSDMVVDRSLAISILGIKQSLAMTPYMPLIAELIGERLNSVPEEQSADLWSQRLFDLEKGVETPIAIWDTGVDSALQGDRMWVNPNQDGPGYMHGIAFGPDFERETNDLNTEAADYMDQMESLYDTLKGSLDLQAGLETPEKLALIQKMQSLAPEDMMAFQKSLIVMGNYVHGQHVADIAAAGNGAAKIVNVKFTWPSDPLPSEPIDEAWAERFVSASQASVDFLKANDVKLVNMSWRLTRPMIETLLQVTGAEPDAEARQARAARIFKIMEDGLTTAFDSAPDILFVAGAGNENENVEFVTSIPAGINLPNVITVGAVDHTLQPAAFTSYGASIDVYANGFEVAGRVPGGRELKLSGTSMAAPQVVNLAGKLWAIYPDLSVSEMVAVLTDTATLEGEEKLTVIHPSKALAALQ